VGFLSPVDRDFLRKRCLLSVLGGFVGAGTSAINGGSKG
jgi:hypothetical protein